MSAADTLFGWERAARQDGAVGVWHAAALHTALLRTPFGEAYGREGLVAAATARAVQLRDQSLGEPLLVSGMEDGRALAAWAAPVTARRDGAMVTGLAGGLARLVDGRAAEVWCFDDTGALCRDTGRDPSDHAAAHPVPPLDIGADPLGSQLPPDPAAALPPGTPAILGRWLAMVAHRRFDRAAELYADGADIVLAGTAETGVAAGTRQLLEVLAALPDAVALPETAVFDPAAPDRAALLWHISGCHTAPGLGAPPTGRRLRLPVLSLFELAGGRIVRERRLLDRVALLACTLAP